MAFAFIFVLFGLFMLLGLALDAGLWYFDHRTAQNQVDAASLAAVQELPSDDTTAAEAAVSDWLMRNGVSDTIAGAGALVTVHLNTSSLTGACLDPIMDAGEARVVFGMSGEAAAGEYDMVRVCVRRSSLVVFGRMVGLVDAIVSAGGTAGVYYEPLPYALMAMNPSYCEPSVGGALDVSGEAGVNLQDGGESYTASDCEANALNVRGNGDFDGAGHDVCGGWHVDGSNADLSPDGTSGICGQPDPWADVDPPAGASSSCVSLPTYNEPSQNGTPLNSIPPGTYCSLTVEGNGTHVELSGGEYVFKNGVTVAGQNTRLFSSDETLIFMTCLSFPCNGTTPAAFDVKGGASGLLKLELIGHDSFEHIAIYVDRTAGEGVCVTITGQGNVLIDGNVYSLGCTTHLAGQGDAEFDINGTIVADRIIFAGQATYNVTWDAESAPKAVDYSLIE